MVLNVLGYFPHLAVTFTKLSFVPFRNSFIYARAHVRHNHGVTTKLEGFIESINEDCSFKNCESEKSLTNFLKKKMSNAGAVLLAEDWEVVPGQSNHGCGDLVFRLPFDIDLVVEVKKIDPGDNGGSSRTHSKTRQTQRQKGPEQAIKYGEIWQQYKSSVGIVAAVTFTEEDGLKCIGWFANEHTTRS